MRLAVALYLFALRVFIIHLRLSQMGVTPLKVRRILKSDWDFISRLLAISLYFFGFKKNLREFS